VPGIERVVSFIPTMQKVNISQKNQLKVRESVKICSHALNQ